MVAKAFFVIPFAFWKLDFNSTNDGFKYSGDILIFTKEYGQRAWP
jgi:hypothetical protein